MLDNTEERAADGHTYITTRDVDRTRQALATLYGEFSFVGGGRQFEWRAESVALGPITVVRAVWHGAVHLHGTPGAYVLNLSAGGFARASRNAAVAEIVPGRSAAMISVGGPGSWSTQGEFAATTIRIDPRFLAAQLEALTGEAVVGPIGFELALDTSRGPGAFVEQLCQLIVSAIEQGTPLDQPTVLTGLYETLARALLTGQPHDHAHLLRQPAPPSGRYVVRKVEEYIEANASEPISSTELSALTGASVLSIEAGFREHRGATPAGFLRAKRLDLARQTLLTDTRMCITRVAQVAGFLRVEAFEIAYFKAFRESPTETRRLGQLAAGGPTPRIEQASTADLFASLSPRERDVCVRVAQGMLNKQIAADLGTSEPTVKKQRARAMQKLGVTSAAELGVRLGRMGILR